MNDLTKNIVSLFLALLIVGGVVFAIMYWLLKEDFTSALSIAIAAALGGWLGPMIMNKLKKNRKVSE